MPRDAYHWRAIYRDGDYLDEYDAACPQGRGFAQVEQARLAAVHLLPQQPGLVAHALSSQHGAEIVFFRRRLLRWRPDTGVEARHTLHVLGLRQGPHASYVLIYPDGSLLLTDDDGAR